MTIEAVILFLGLCLIFGFVFGFVMRCLRIGKVHDE